ncbi:MAG: preprotein translocase subunit SecD [Methanobacteriaceae archaeon]|nr:preprotein translocase subunit SecD [Methanobacteriaceae archaeon]
MDIQKEQFIKNPRTILLIVLLLASIISLCIFGLQEGLDLKGGSMIQLHLEKPVDQDTMNTVTAVLDKRLNAFGVSDVKVRQSGDQDVIVEIAGVTPDQVENIVKTPGKFEAKIGNETAISGSDVQSVSSKEVTGERWKVPFKITTEGANKFAKVAEGKAGTPVDMYLDDELISSPQLDAGLANGVPSSEVEVSGGETSKAKATEKATEVHTVLQSGALPVKLNIVSVNSISADLGNQFELGALIAGFLALAAIAVVVTFKYKSWALVIPIMVTSISELVLILGFASIIQWNLDLAAIAGIIAAIGTGVDDQIVMTDEVLAHQDKKSHRKNIVKTKIKGAFFIIYASAGTLIAAMLPLAYVGFARGSTGIGMLTGFAVTTIVGVLFGIFVTRPVFAQYIETFFVKSPKEIEQEKRRERKSKG